MKQEIEETKGDKHDSLHPFSSFNLTMEEEHKKIRNHTVYMVKAKPGQGEDKDAADNKYDSKEFIPCDFLRYVANVKDDLE